jgi:hypothetical protein
MTKIEVKSPSGIIRPSASRTGLPSASSFAFLSAITSTVPSGAGSPGLAALSLAGLTYISRTRLRSGRSTLL